jgi:enoyl-CoA hydratase/carnithine racemase
MAEAKAGYVKIPTFEEYKEMFKEHFDLKREDGILQVTMQTNGGKMYWSGAAHRAMSQLVRFISMDHDNEVLIWTHEGPNWMQDTDPGGWGTYDAERFDHQYFDDTNLIKNMVMDLEIPSIGVMQGPGFHWDSILLCDITLAAEDCRWDDFHFQYGLVPGDGMGMLMQHFLGTKRAAYYMYTSRQWDAKQALEWGWINEICPKGTVLDRAWEIARMIKSVPREPRTITANLVKQPLAKMVMDNLKLHTVSEQYSTLIMKDKKEIGAGKKQMDEKDASVYMHWRYAPETDIMLQPQSLKTWNYLERTHKWAEEKRAKGEEP